MQACLQRVELRMAAVDTHQFGMAAAFDDSARFQQQDLIDIANAGKAVRN